MLGLCLTFAPLTHQSPEISMVVVVVQFYSEVVIKVIIVKRPIIVFQDFSNIYRLLFGVKSPPPPAIQHPSNSDLLSIISPLFLGANQ